VRAFAVCAGERQHGCQRHRDEAAHQQRGRLGTSMQQAARADVADHVHRGGQRRQHAGGSTRDARLRVDRWQKADHANHWPE
jgi:hypothetical protein